IPGQGAARSGLGAAGARRNICAACRRRAPMSESQAVILSAADPYDVFRKWMEEATAREPSDPTAMALSTCTRDGMPSVRMVLLKGADSRGFVFYSNAESRKGGELAAN